MSLKQPYPSGSSDDLNPADLTASEETSVGSRRQFLSRLSQMGASLVAGLSLVQATAAHSETAPAVSATPEPPKESVSSSPGGAATRNNGAAYIPVAGIVTTFTYNKQGYLKTISTASGKQRPCPNDALGTASSGDSNSKAEPTPVARHGQ
jgi:YD repeat-containing protein